MNIKQISFVVGVLTILVFSSCKKDSLTDQASPQIVLSDSNYLSKIYFTRVNGLAIDTSVDSFVFDDLKRVSLYLQTYNYNVNGIITKYIDTTTFYYSSSEMLPYKSIEYINSPVINDTTLRFLSYSNSGSLIKDSILKYSHHIGSNDNISKTISMHTYTGNKIYINTSTTQDLGLTDILIEKDTLTMDANTNVIAKSSYIYSNNNSSNNTSTFSTYTYGTNPSPMVNLNINNKLGYTNDGSYFLHHGSKNNILSITVNSYANSIYQGTFVQLSPSATIYTFKANGYPASLQTSSFNPNDGKLFYTYKSL